MSKVFKTAAAFRAALEERLKQQATRDNVPLATLRLKVAIERLLARVFKRPDAPWLLKGGYAMELRYRPRARTTKDIDLSVKTGEGDLAARLVRLRDDLQQTAANNPGDYFEFQIGSPNRELQGAPDGGARFPLAALLAGRVFARFHLDVGFGDPSISPAENLVGQDFLGFAGIAPASVLAIARPQQFAEKLHAFTFSWNDRQNTRTKDLVDLVLFVTVDPPDTQELARAIEATFRTRNTHPLPAVLAAPPESWKPVFTAMAKEANLPITDIEKGFRIVAEFVQTFLPSVS